jgi:hypothetical protein
MHARAAGVHMEDIVDDELDLPENRECEIQGHQTQIRTSKEKMSRLARRDHGFQFRIPNADIVSFAPAN